MKFKIRLHYPPAAACLQAHFAAFSLAKRHRMEHTGGMGTLDEKLLEAAYRGDRVRVQCLLAGGTDARAVAEYGEAALERAVECGNAAVGRLLLESGVEYDFSKDDARHLL